jgi:flagellar biosynthesis protein FlhG
MTYGRLIAIASGKGGVGKTWLCITLAHALATRGRRVLLFDADLGLANVDIQLGLTPKRDLVAVLANKATLAEAIIQHEAGFHVLAGRSGSGVLSGLSPTAVEQVLEIARTAAVGYDITLLDLGAGLEYSVRRLAAAADELLIVTTDEPTSLTDGYAVLKLHSQDNPAGTARIVVNQAPSPSAGERTYATIRRAAHTFLGLEPDLAGIVRRDPRVPDTIRNQTLLLTRSPQSHAAADVEQLCQALL